VCWGAPNGIEFGANGAALQNLASWIEVAGSCGIRTMRIVAGGPALRDRASQWHTAVAPLRTAAALARTSGITLALENHGDLKASEISDLLEQVADEGLQVCFDTANALRVGDDVTEAAALLGPRIRMVHFKDVEPLETVSNPIAGPRSVPYGQGVIPLEEVFGVLERVGFDGLVCVEIGQLSADDDERQMVLDSVSWLRARERTVGGSG